MPVVWRFANAEYHEASRELRVDGTPVALERKPLEVLRCLLLAEGELVTKQELFDTVWAGRVVTDGVLSQAIFRIREVLGDAERSLLRTVHGYGFRLDAPIAVEGREDAGTRLDFEAGAAVPGLDGWLLEARLGTRPHNELWRVRHTESDQCRVLKLALGERAERALRREVTLNRVLFKELGDDAPLVRLERWQFDAAPHWILMPWYPAGSLEDWIARSGGVAALPLQRRIDIVAEAAEVLARAHTLGVMHKDIKPGNLLVDESGAEPHLLMCDFGSGTVASRERLERAGVTVMGFTQTLKTDVSTTGTPAYMAPEVLAGGVFSERSDVYALGVLLYQLAAGNLHQPLAPGWEEDIDDVGLRNIVAGACAGKPERRIGSMADLARQLRDWRRGAATPATRPTPDAEPVARAAMPRGPARWGIAAGLALLAGLAGWALLGPQSQEAAAPGVGVTAAIPRVAILPFELRGVDDESTAVLSGLQEALISDLVQVSGWQLRLGRNLAALGVADASPAQIGTALGADRLIRGSVQQAGDELQVNLRIVDAPSGDLTWSRAVRGSRQDLFDLQRRIGRELASALDAEAPASAAGGQGVDPQAYEYYLVALSQLGGEPASSGNITLYQRAVDGLDRALERVPDFIDAHVLAVVAVSGGYWYSVLDRAEAQARIEEHLRALTRLDTPAVKLALARAMKRYYLDFDTAGGVALLAPFEPRIRRDALAARYYAAMLRRVGRFDEARDWLRRATQLRPGDFAPLAILIELGHWQGDARATHEVLELAVQRLPGNAFVAVTKEMYAYLFTGDADALAEFEAFTRTLPADNRYHIEIGIQRAYRQGDFARVSALRRQHPEDGLRFWGHDLQPRPLLVAMALNLTSAPAAEVQAAAARALAELERARERSDSPFRQMRTAQALALAGRREEALALSEAVLRDMPPERDLFNASELGLQAALVFAWLGAEERLLSLIEAALRGPLPGRVCSDLMHDISFAAVHRIPSASAVMSSACAERIDTARRVYLDDTKG